MSDPREQYLEWLLNGKQGPRPGGYQSKLGVPVGEPTNPDAGLPALLGERGMAPIPPPPSAPVGAAGGAALGEGAALSPWVGLPAAAAALYSKDANPSNEDDIVNKILGRGDADPAKKQDIFQNVSDAYSRVQNKGEIGGDAPKVIPAKQAPTPKTMAEAKPTTPQIKSIDDLRVKQRLLERKQLQDDMGLTPQSADERQQEVDSIRGQSDNFSKRFQDRVNMRKTLK